MSLTIQGLIVGIVGLFIHKVGLNVDSQALQTTVDTLFTIISAGMIYWGRYRHGDITVIGRKK